MTPSPQQPDSKDQGEPCDRIYADGGAYTAKLINGRPCCTSCEHPLDSHAKPQSFETTPENDGSGESEPGLLDAISDFAVVMEVQGPDHYRNMSRVVLAVPDWSVNLWREFEGKELPRLLAAHDARRAKELLEVVKEDEPENIVSGETYRVWFIRGMNEEKARIRRAITKIYGGSDE